MKALNTSQCLETLFVTVIITCSISAFAGGANGGGGFKYYYTSGASYRESKAEISRPIEHHDVPISSLDAIAAKYGIHVDWDEFAHIVKTGKSQALKNATRKNPDGDDEPLVMDNDPTTRTIFALEPFFLFFDKEKLSDADLRYMRVLIIHEASHLFKLGNNGDDSRSRDFANDVESLIKKYAYDCGTSGDLSKRTADCKDLGYGDSGDGSQVVMNLWSAYQSKDEMVVQDKESHLLYAAGPFNTGSGCRNLPTEIKSLANWRQSSADEAKRILTQNNSFIFPEQRSLHLSLTGGSPPFCVDVTSTGRLGQYVCENGTSGKYGKLLSYKNIFGDYEVFFGRLIVCVGEPLQ